MKTSGSSRLLPYDCGLVRFAKKDQSANGAECESQGKREARRPPGKSIKKRGPGLKGRNNVGRAKADRVW